MTIRETGSWVWPAVLASTLVAALSLLISPGASAAPAAVPACPASHFCLYRDTNYGGAIFVLPLAAHGPQDLRKARYSDGEVVAASASSMKNNTASAVPLYSQPNCSGSYGYGAAPRSVDPTFVNNNFDNMAYCLRGP